MASPDSPDSIVQPALKRPATSNQHSRISSSDVQWRLSADEPDIATSPKEAKHDDEVQRDEQRTKIAGLLLPTTRQKYRQLRHIRMREAVPGRPSRHPLYPWEVGLPTHTWTNSKVYAAYCADDGSITKAIVKRPQEVRPNVTKPYGRPTVPDRTAQQ